MILFFDTETTGLPDDRMPPWHKCQPHLVQIAAVLTENDQTERASFNLIVDPEVPIPPNASAVHGITNEIAQRCGVSSSTATEIFSRFALLADTIVAHNIKFDWALMETAFFRLPNPKNIDEYLGERTRFCTMEAATPVVNLPPTERMIAAGITKPKPPRLEECIQHFFQENLLGAHDALVDVRACARLYFHLRSLEKVAA